MCDGKEPTSPIISESNEMELKFHSDSSERLKGFMAVYETGKDIIGSLILKL